jgi:hypothetical protein
LQGLTSRFRTRRAVACGERWRGDVLREVPPAAIVLGKLFRLRRALRRLR